MKYLLFFPLFLSWLNPAIGTHQESPSIDHVLYGEERMGDIGLCLMPQDLEKSLKETKLCQQVSQSPYPSLDACINSIFESEQKQSVPIITSYLLTLMKYTYGEQQQKFTKLFIQVNPAAWEEVSNFFQTTVGMPLYPKGFSGIGTLDLLGRMAYYLHGLNKTIPDEDFRNLHAWVLQAMGALYSGAFGLKDKGTILPPTEQDIMIRELVHLGIHSTENIQKYIREKLMLRDQYKTWDKANISVLIERAIVAAAAYTSQFPYESLSLQKIAQDIGSSNGYSLTETQVALALKKYNVYPYLEKIKAAINQKQKLEMLEEPEGLLVPEYLKSAQEKKEYVNYIDKFDLFIKDFQDKAAILLPKNLENIMKGVTSITKFAQSRWDLARMFPLYEKKYFNGSFGSFFIWSAREQDENWRARVTTWQSQHKVPGFFYTDSDDLRAKWEAAKGDIQTYRKFWASTFYENYKVLVGSFVYAKANNKLPDLLQKAFDFEQHCTPSVTRPIADWMLKQTAGGAVDELVYEADQFALNNRFLHNTVRNMLAVLERRYNDGNLYEKDSRSKKVDPKNLPFKGYARSEIGKKNLISKIATQLKTSAYENLKVSEMMDKRTDFEYDTKENRYPIGSYVTTNDGRVYLVNDSMSLEILVENGYKYPDVTSNSAELNFKTLEEYIGEIIKEAYS